MPSDGFPLVWIQMIMLIPSTSSKCSNSINAILTYSEQDVQSLVTNFHRDAKKLSATTQYEQSLKHAQGL